MKKLKQILALFVVIFLVSLYVLTFIASLINSPQQANMLQACIYSTVVIPIFLWAYTLVYRCLKNNNQQVSFEDTTEEQNTSEIQNDTIQKQTKDTSK